MLMLQKSNKFLLELIAVARILKTEAGMIAQPGCNQQKFIRHNQNDFLIMH